MTRIGSPPGAAPRIPHANRSGASFILDAPNRQSRQPAPTRDELALGGTVERPADAFVRARSHSRRVRWLKIGLPVVATAIVLAGVAATWLARSLPADIAFASTSIEDGRLIMRDPRMSGVDGNDRPFSMVASRAIQALGGSSIDLEGVRANLTVDAGTTAELTAAKGRFDTRTNMLRLYDQIAVDTTSGIRIRMQSADVALEGGTLTGTGPVEIATSDQRLEAGNISVSNGGKTLSFGNRVKLTLLPKSLSNGGDAPTSEPGP